MSDFQGGTFTVGSGPDATFQWSATSSKDDQGAWWVQVFCNYGGGTATNNTSQTDPIAWGVTDCYPMYQVQPNPDIEVNGTIMMSWNATPGTDFAAQFYGDMTLNAAPTNTIGAQNIYVASNVSGAS